MAAYADGGKVRKIREQAVDSEVVNEKAQQRFEVAEPRRQCVPAERVRVYFEARLLCQSDKIARRQATVSGLDAVKLLQPGTDTVDHASHLGDAVAAQKRGVVRIGFTPTGVR